MLSRSDLEFILGRRVAHLATTDAAGLPHVVPVCFAYSDGQFWITIDEKPKRTLRLKRLRNIEENPNVALIFDRYDDDWSRLGYIMVRGRAFIMDRGPEHERALVALRRRYPQYEAMRLEKFPAIRIDPERVARWGDLR